MTLAKKILVYKHGRPSTMEIFQSLNDPNIELIFKSVKFDGYVVRQKERVKRKIMGPDISAEDSILIRWGNRIPVTTNNHTICYNHADKVKIVNEKGNCRKFLQDNNIAVPKTYLLNEINSMINNNTVEFPLIGRPEHHGRGSHFYEIANTDQLRNAIQHGCTYFSKIYPKTREFGVHVGHGKVLAVMEKPRPKDNKTQWNRALNDEPFTYVPQDSYKNYICRLALDAMKAVGLDFGRVDIMSDPENYQGLNLPRAVVCEINTAPTLNSSPHVMSKWVAYFKWLFASERRREHWNYTVFEAASSLAWKNYQLEPDFVPPNESRS